MARRLDKIRNMYPSQVLTEDTIEGYLKKFEGIIKEHNLEALDRAIEKAVDNCKFFPTIADIREYLPEPKPQDGLAAAMRARAPRGKEPPLQ
jgi:hypothetical protein